jgi:hypothetical protein
MEELKFGLGAQQPGQPGILQPQPSVLLGQMVIEAGDARGDPGCLPRLLLVPAERPHEVAAQSIRAGEHGGISTGSGQIRPELDEV